MLRVDGRLEDGSGVARPAVKMTALVRLLLLCRGRRLGLRAGLTSSPWDPEHWRQRAEQIRALLDDMRDAESRATMLRIAEDYDGLARRAEERLRKPSD
jgi:hypothetical protein